MGFNITNAVAELLLDNDEGLPTRLRRQEENLKKKKCINTEIGKWLEDFELPFLIDIFNSPDEYFGRKFTEMKDFALEQRKALLKEIEEHAKICEHCRLKISYDLEWDREVEAAIFNHRRTLKKSLGRGRRRVLKNER
ncbi:MAG: hypothetical protein M3384_19685 [Acidobacteriota bacterium]|nr:hypothetical protein [Acidobacteriota bacterium]